MKKSALFYGLMFLLHATVSAQNDAAQARMLEDATILYGQDQFNAAIPLYRELVDRGDTNPAVTFTLAECYRKIFNYPEAEAYYLKTIYQRQRDYPLALYYYALMLKLNGRFDESILQFDKFIDQYQHEEKLREYVEQAMVDRDGSIMAKSRQSEEKISACNLLPTGINTIYNDFAPAAYDSMTLAITSSRVLSNRVVIDERFGEAFCDNYYFQKNETGWHDRTKARFNALNSRYNDGSGCFNSSGDRYYFTVCGKDGSQCKIFCSVLKGGKWNEPVALNDNINFKRYESKQPAISHGGDTLLFASNRPGGMGQYDLWMSINDGDDHWGPPMNLGSNINTKLNELSPAFTPLPFVFFFASDGHEGYGGLDLYMSKKLSSGETVVYNLNAPYNSNRDDCFLNVQEKIAYFCSNREGGFGGFDIYTARILSPIAFVSRVSLTKHDSRRNIRLHPKTETQQKLTLLASRNEEKIDYDDLTYEKRKAVDRMVAERMQHTLPEKSKFKNLSQEEFDALDQLSKERYETFLMQRRFKGAIVAHLEITSDIPDDYLVTGTLTDSLTDVKQPSVTLYLTDEFGEALKTTRTNDDGSFRFTDVPSGKKLFILSENSFRDASQHLVVKNLVMQQSSDQNIIYGENIYFDFDHYVIRPEARKVLDELATYLKKNQNVQVEIFAFADDRGSQEYNLSLTQKRGQSVVDYLTSHGVDATALAIVSRGKLVNPEGSDELQRQLSRRVEFYLNGVKADLQDETKTYILRSESTWTTLSKIMHVEKDILKKLNNSTDEELKAFQPVRVPSIAILDVSGELFFAIN